MIKIYFFSLFFFFVTLQPVHAAFELKNCIALLKGPTASLDELESMLPKFSHQADTYFSRNYDFMGLPGFYSLKDRPQYYLWLLHHDLAEAKTVLQRHLDGDESFSAQSRIVFLGSEFLSFSNLRNSWTEFAAYSADASLSASQKDKISANMMGLTASASVYFGCLMAHIQGLGAE